MPKTLVDTLVAKNLLDLTRAGEAKKAAKEKGVSIEDILYQFGVREEDVAEAKSELTGHPARYLRGGTVPFDILHYIPEESARHYRMIPLGKDGGYLDVGMLAPEDVAAQEALKFISARSNLPTRIFIITPTDFQSVLQEYKNLSGEVTQALGEFSKEYPEFGLGEEIKITKEEPAKIVEEAPITKMIGVIIRHAVDGLASDVHIEPARDHLRVRFRVDGVLHTSLRLPIGVHPAFVTRVKVMTNLKIDETRVPQDGRFHAEIGGHEIDFRVSLLPTSFGEKIAIRILNPQAGIAKLEDLGLEGRNATLLQESIKKPYGLILITGPTGSGKSTTLYALLQLLNQEGVNIISLEDPVEYYIPGVNQSQIRPEIGYDFATGLRHILRQDPDVIMVGEIRDKETAALAIHAALTGHLVLSTLHTNNAIGVVPRLVDMGVEPFLISTTLVLAVGQRLVRKLCPDSRKTTKVTGKIKELITKEFEGMPEALKAEFKKSFPAEIYQAEVSPTCPKGTRGRTGIFETLAMTPELEKIILVSPSEAQIAEEARRQGMSTMRQDGMSKIAKGIIGLEDLLEVT